MASRPRSARRSGCGLFREPEGEGKRVRKGRLGYGPAEALVLEGQGEIQRLATGDVSCVDERGVVFKSGRYGSAAGVSVPGDTDWSLAPAVTVPYGLMLTVPVMRP